MVSILITLIVVSRLLMLFFSESKEVKQHKILLQNVVDHLLKEGFVGKAKIPNDCSEKYYLRYLKGDLIITLYTLDGPLYVGSYFIVDDVCRCFRDSYEIKTFEEFKVFLEEEKKNWLQRGVDE